MMKVDTVCMEEQARRMQVIVRQLDEVASRVNGVNQNLRWKNSVSATIQTSLALHRSGVMMLKEKSDTLHQALGSAVSEYTEAESKNAKIDNAVNQPAQGDTDTIVDGNPSDDNERANELWDKIYEKIKDKLVDKIGDLDGMDEIEAWKWDKGTIWKAITNIVINSGEQAVESVQDYSSDGKWSLMDTANTGIDVSMEGLYTLANELTDGIADKIFGAVEHLAGGDGSSGLSYAEQAAEGYRILADKIADKLVDIFKK